MLYEAECDKCRKVSEIIRHHSLSGEPYACNYCGGVAKRIYSFTVFKEFPAYAGKGGVRVSSRKTEAKYLRKNGRVLTQDTAWWGDTKKQIREGQRRTRLSQKGHN